MKVILETADEFLTVKEAARIVRLHPVTVYRLERAGQFIERIRISVRKTGFLRSDLLRWMASRERGLRAPVCQKRAA
jgi:predicted DNA-binding transcriptional regulator AlpA